MTRRFYKWFIGILAILFFIRGLKMAVERVEIGEWVSFLAMGFIVFGVGIWLIVNMKPNENIQISSEDLINQGKSNMLQELLKYFFRLF